MDGLKTKEDRRFQTFWVIFFILISVIAIIPVLRVISISFSGRDAINKGQVFIFPIGFNVDAYAKALKSGTFVSSFGYSIILMAVVTAVDMIMTILLAYPLSRKGLKGSKIVNLFCVITMYLNLGTIPNYLNIKSFGMIDTVWALIIPGALSVYNMIIMRTAFASIDDSLYEAARIDGCGEFGGFGAHRAIRLALRRGVALHRQFCRAGLARLRLAGGGDFHRPLAFLQRQTLANELLHLP